MYSILNPQHCGHLNFKSSREWTKKKIGIKAKSLKNHMYIKWNSWVFESYICQIESHEHTNCTMKQHIWRMMCAFLPVLHECQDLLEQTLITPGVLLQTAHCASFSDGHDFSNSLHNFTWNLMHSFSIFSHRLLTEMDGLIQCFPTFSPWMKH